MGQQQLLLLVLGIVIVGLAVVVGINAFSENRTKSNADALVTDALRVASDVQAWALKPGQFGGMLDAETLADVTLDKIGYPNSGGIYDNVNGDFSFTAPSGITCTAVAAADVPSGTAPVVTIYASNDDTGNCITVGIAGTSADDIGTKVAYGTGS
ncbi:MAG: hypothetical protein R3247_05955 [Rhodothermales bacterium]|nr:hypothetical protein [Rhodothermales bacterium]